MRPFPGFISLPLIIFVVSITIVGVPRALTGRETPREEKAAENKAGEDLEPVPSPPLDHLEKAIELASKSSSNAAIVENLKSNLEYFKTNRPCRVPAQQERETKRNKK